MNNSNKNIEIISGDFFPAWTFALSFVLVIGAVVAVGYQLLFTYEPVYIDRLLAYSFAVFSMFFSAFVWFSKCVFEFNPQTRQYRDGYCYSLLGLKLGKWQPLEIRQAYIAFQRYDENIHYTYGGLFNKYVKDTVFELRIVYPDLTFKTLVRGRDFKSVTQMLQLGKMLSLTYGVEFNDFVKGIIRKESAGK